tara:strand:+ start:380 stop:832 length:453 start_codon:yes stop_codon:yes gene_type:complete
MKFNIVLVFVLATFSLDAVAGHHEKSSVEGFIADYFETFNSMTLEANPEQSISFPVVFINDGKVRVIEDTSEKVFDYNVIKATGWAYSKIIKTTVLDEGENSAVVLVDFARHKADDSVMSTSKVFYTLSMTEDGWKLVGASIPGGITLIE